MAMTAHCPYTALDPNACASLSPLVIGDLIRGEFGFDGLLMSDDLGMKAVGGPVAERALGALSAGCDFALHCSGVLAAYAEIGRAHVCTPVTNAHPVCRLMLDQK